ncbi:MAG: mechanosensitive ion channel domain-containing protein, partial [Rhodoferax sp.]
MEFSISGIEAQSALLATLSCALLGMVLRMFSTAGRRELRGVWFFICMAFVAVAGTNLAANLGAEGWARGLEYAANSLSVVASLLVGVVLIFQILMPTVGIAVPRIAQDLTLTAAVCASAVYGLGRLGVEPSNLFTTSAIFTAVLAFAMQDTLGNVLGGVVLQLDRSLKVGDYVRVDDFSGTVVDVRWRYTAIETGDREVVILPNS